MSHSNVGAIEFKILEENSMLFDEAWKFHGETCNGAQVLLTTHSCHIKAQSNILSFVGVKLA